MSPIKGQLTRVLLDKRTVVTRAVFWSVAHATEKEDIKLKLGRYKKSSGAFEIDDDLESLKPKSELTLDQAEFKALIDFLQESYEPFRQGVKAFIPLERSLNSEYAARIKEIFAHPNKEGLIQLILTHNIIPEELETGLRQAYRSRAVREFSEMLDQDLAELSWQRWFQDNSWVLGSQFVRILDDRRIDTGNIADFLMEAYDGFLDIVEIKRPGRDLEFWSQKLDRGNYVQSSELTKAITQAAHYIYKVELEANSIKFLSQVGGVRTVKPRCVLVFGRSKGWNNGQLEAYRILNSSFHNLTVLTYDHVLQRAKRIVGLDR